MTLVTTDFLLQKAQRGRYAVGAFNVNNLEIMQAIVRAAKAQHSPAILQTSEGAIEYAGLEELCGIISTAATHSEIPLALHLDHGKDLGLIRKCIKIGYTSVMIDGSHYAFAENIRTTAKVVRWAHAKGVSVEAELGTIGGAEDKVSSRTITLTDPEAAIEFVERTGCDSLAVAIGTSHGAYKFAGTGKLDILRLRQIRQRVKIPLVLHGASGVPTWLVTLAEKYGAKLGGVEGVPESQVGRAIASGICKVNTDTDLRIAFDAGVRQQLASAPSDFDPRHILGGARAVMQKVVENRMKLFGSGGKA